MVRQKRLYFSKAVYHISTRGNNGQYVLRDNSDKIALLVSLSKFKNRFGFKIFALGLMDNHAHLIIETGAANSISKIMQAIQLSYSFKFRKKYGYKGYVWQGRFRSNVISGYKYIISCIEYIHNNPVRSGIVTKPDDYIWSSYNFYHGKTDPLKEYIVLDRFEG